MKRIRIGLLGCGTIAQYSHLPALQKADNVELAAICDVAEDLLQEVARQLNLRCFSSDYRRFLEDSDVDAVLIATADRYHVQQATDCLMHGKHVLVEKPLGLDLEECRRLAEVVEETGKKLQVGYMKRFDPGIEFGHRFIKSEMGLRLAVSGWYCDSLFRPAMQKTLRPKPIRSLNQLGSAPFKGDKKSYNLITHGSHLVDILRHFGGEIVALQAKLATKYEQFSWHGVLEYADGAVGHFELTTAAKTDWLEGFRVHGEWGSVEVRSFLPFFNRPSDVRLFDAKRGEYRSPLVPDSDPYERQLEAFARSILDDAPSEPNVYDGIADLAVIRAIQRSVETGRWTEVPVEPRAKLVSK